MNLTKYSQAFKEDVVRKMLGRGNRTIADMADELNVWCRTHGLFPHQLQTWKAEFCGSAKPATDAGEVRKLKGNLAILQRELDRKEKALSEAAALLVLQKKYQALWEDEDK